MVSRQGSPIGREHERSIEQHMQRMLRELVREDMELQYARATVADVDLATRYVVGTLWAVVRWWMDGNKIFQRMTFPGLEAIIGTDS